MASTLANQSEIPVNITGHDIGYIRITNRQAKWIGYEWALKVEFFQVC